MEDGHIETTFDFRTDAGKRRMTALMERYPRKYLMFRIEGVGNEARAKIIRQICRVKRFNFLEYTEGKHMIAITRAEQTDASMPCMEDKPAKTTVILVKGRLRAGKVVPKAHVGFVWENATNPRTDSIVQGLLGRMCGYLGTSVFQVPLGGDVKPRIFLPQAVLEKKTDTVVPLSELDRHLARDSDILPRCGTNLKKTTVAAAPDNGRTQVATLMIKRELFGEDVEYFESGERNREHMKRMCLDTLKAHADEILAQHPVGTITDDQKAEIRTRVESAEVNQVMSRMLDGNKHHSGAANSYYKQLRAAYASHSVPKEHIEGSPYMTFAIVLAPRNEAGARPGDVYVVMYTDAANTGFGTVSARDKVAEENGKSLFGVRVREAAIAGGAATLDSNATRSPVDFMAAMGEYLDMSRRGVYVHHEKTIVPVADKFVFDKVAFEYVNSRTNALEQSIKPTLERMYGIRVKITYNSGPSGRTTFAVKKISWD